MNWNRVGWSAVAFAAFFAALICATASFPGDRLVSALFGGVFGFSLVQLVLDRD